MSMYVHVCMYVYVYVRVCVYVQNRPFIIHINLTSILQGARGWLKPENRDAARLADGMLQ